MHFFLIAATLTVTPEAVESYVSIPTAARSMQEDVETGTLLFSEGDCLAIRVFTQSSFTHVGAVVMRQGEPFVYDSMNGVGVRRQTLKSYLQSQNCDEFYVVQPKENFSDEQARLFREHLKEELGRPYDIKHHLTGKRDDGVHCAEYITDAMMSCHLIHANQPSRVSPASLLEGLLKSDLYQTETKVCLEEPEIAESQADGWCSRLWIDTKQCTRNCCSKLKGWFLCK